MMHYEPLDWPKGVGRKKRESRAYYRGYNDQFWAAVKCMPELITHSILAAVLAFFFVISLILATQHAFQAHAFRTILFSVIAIVLVVVILWQLKNPILPCLADCKTDADKAGTKAQKAAERRGRRSYDGYDDAAEEEDPPVIEGSDIMSNFL